MVQGFFIPWYDFIKIGISNTMDIPKQKTSYAHPRSPRADGDDTRSHLIEVAGRLFATHGFESVTSKMICETAQVNIAAVNYHFGSREGLYRATLLDVHQHLANLDVLNQLAQAPLPAQRKLELIIRAILAQLGDQNWRIRFYIREAIAFNDIFLEIFMQQAVPKSRVLRQIFSQISGLKEDDPKLPHIVLSVLAPCILPLLVNRKAITAVWGEKTFQPDILAQHISQFAWTGIQNINTLATVTSKETANQ